MGRTIRRGDGRGGDGQEQGQSTMGQSTITLFLDRGVWMARFGGPAKADLEALFGEDKIPTPYLAAMPAMEVARRIAHRNPGADVYVGRMRFRPGRDGGRLGV